MQARPGLWVHTNSGVLLYPPEPFHQQLPDCQAWGPSTAHALQGDKPCLAHTGRLLWCELYNTSLNYYFILIRLVLLICNISIVFVSLCTRQHSYSSGYFTNISGTYPYICQLELPVRVFYIIPEDTLLYTLISFCKFHISVDRQKMYIHAMSIFVGID